MVRLFDDEYNNWESFNESKNAAHITRVKELDSKQRIHGNTEKLLAVEREQFHDHAHLNESLQFYMLAIYKALQALLIPKEYKNKSPKNGITSSGAAKAKIEV